jgi:hypothetical protein
METVLFLLALSILLVWCYTTGEKDKTISTTLTPELNEIRVGEDQDPASLSQRRFILHLLWRWPFFITFAVFISTQETSEVFPSQLRKSEKSNLLWHWPFFMPTPLL